MVYCRAREHSSEVQGLLETASIGEKSGRGVGRTGGSNEGPELPELQEEEEEENLERLQEEVWSRHPLVNISPSPLSLSLLSSVSLPPPSPSQLKELQTKFNKCAVKKHTLDQTCSQLAESLKSTSHLMARYGSIFLFSLSSRYHPSKLGHFTYWIPSLCSLQSRRKAWQHCLSNTPSHNLLLANCLLAAAVTTYCGPYSTLSRFTIIHIS